MARSHLCGVGAAGCVLGVRGNVCVVWCVWRMYRNVLCLCDVCVYVVYVCVWCGVCIVYAGVFGMRGGYTWGSCVCMVVHMCIEVTTLVTTKAGQNSSCQGV